MFYDLSNTSVDRLILPIVICYHCRSGSIHQLQVAKIERLLEYNAFCESPQ